VLGTPFAEISCARSVGIHSHDDRWQLVCETGNALAAELDLPGSSGSPRDDPDDASILI